MITGGWRPPPGSSSAPRAARHRLVRGLLRGLGPGQRVRAALPRGPRAQRHADGAAGRGAGAARRAGPPADGDARRSLRRARRVHGVDGGVGGARRAGALAATYRSLLVVAFFLGLAGSSFPVGVGYVSRWTPPARQGGALGIYGLGNIGQSAAVFLGPAARRARRLAGRVFRGVARCCSCWAVGVRARWRATRPARPPAEGLGAMLRVLARERLAWVLAAFYFLTFGGFVAFSIYLPTPAARTSSASTPADAGFRTAGLRGAGDAAASGRRLARRPHRRRARAARRVPRRRAVRAAAGLAVDDARSRWARSAARRCSGSATARCSSWCRSTSRRRPAPSPAWSARWAGSAASSRRCCSASSATAWAWSGPASCCSPLTALALGRVNARVFLPRQEAAELRAAAGAAAHRRPAARRRLGHAGDRAARGRDRGRLAQPAELRPRARRLHVRRRLRDLGRRLPLRVWLQKPPTRVYWRRGWQLVRERGVLARACRVLARVAGTHLVGADASSASARRCAGGCTSSSSGAACWRWRSRSRSSSAGSTSRTPPDDQMTYVDLPLRLPDAASLPAAHRARAGSSSTASTSRRCWCSPASRSRCGGACATAARCAVQTFAMRLLPADPALRDLGHRPRAHRLARSGCAARYYGFLAILHAITVIAALLYLPVRQVLPHLPAARRSSA